MIAALSALIAYGLPIAPPTLNIGDPAPALKTVRWLKGQPTSQFRPGEIYVVEFWATWCTPCKENIPHLTDMAKRYQGKASIIGISIWESNDPKESAYLDKVAAFVKDQGARMDYNVGVDLPGSTVGNSWMKAAGEAGIPTSFIVGKDGRIAWIGHPARLESALDEVIAGTFDVIAARSNRDFSLRFQQPIKDAIAARDYPKVIAAIDRAVAEQPSLEATYTYDRFVALFHTDIPAARTQADALVEQNADNVGLYRMLVSIFASQKDLGKPAYEYGRDLAARAVRLGEMKYMFLAMSAEIQASLGDYKGAVAFQESAVTEATTDSHCPKEFLEFLKRNLEGFRSKAR